MDIGLKKAYIIYECWTDNDDVGHWLLDRNISYSIRVTGDAKQVPQRLRAVKDNDSWIIYSAYLECEDATAIGITFINTVITEAKAGPDVRTLIRGVVEKMV